MIYVSHREQPHAVEGVEREVSVRGQLHASASQLSVELFKQPQSYRNEAQSQLAIRLCCGKRI